MNILWIPEHNTPALKYHFIIIKPFLYATMMLELGGKPRQRIWKEYIAE